MPQTTGCDSLLASYTDFSKTVLHSGPEVFGARSIEVGLAATNGANRLIAFSGVAGLAITGGADNQLLRGQVEIILDALTLNPAASLHQDQFVDFDMSSLVQYNDGNAYAGLAGIANLGRDLQTTFAVDCVSLTPAFRVLNGKQRFVPVIRMAVATAGAQNWTWVESISYQANLQVTVGFDFQVGTAAGGFGSSVTVNAGDPWIGRVRVPTPVQQQGGLPVTLTSVNPDRVPVPPSVTILQNQMQSIFSPPLPPKFGPPPAEVSVPVVATLNGLTSTAVVQVKAHL